MHTGEIHLPDTALIQGAPALEMRRRATLDKDPHRHAARLGRHERRQPQQVVGFKRQERCALTLDAARIETPFQVQQASYPRIPSGVATRHALHRDPRISMAIRTRFFGAACTSVPELGAFFHPQHAGIGKVIGLHGTQVCPHVTAPRTQGVRCGTALLSRRRQANRGQRKQPGRKQAHGAANRRLSARRAHSHARLHRRSTRTRAHPSRAP